jgi:rubrerythrin
MKSLKGTETLKNLMKSFAGESQARNRYQIFAGVAKKEGYELISNIFLETAENERLHAKEFYKFMVEGFGEDKQLPVNITADYPVFLGDTVANLKAAAEGENEEHTLLYPTFAKTAHEEGFPEIASKYYLVSAVEVHHEQRYLKLMELVKSNSIFNKTEVVTWQCLKCGHSPKGQTPPEVCPICNHPRAYFIIKCECF